MAAVAGYTLTVGTSATNLLGQSEVSGAVELWVRADDPNVFMGGTDVDGSLPSSGFELVQGEIYKLRTEGVSQLRVATSTGSASVSVFRQPSRS